MELEGYVQAILKDLGRVAAIGADESTARAAELLAVALESSLGRRMQDALAEAALELSAQLEQGRVELRVAGADPQLVYVDDAGGASARSVDGALDARITLRLPESQKSRVEAAAAGRGVSVNTWLVQTIDRALERPSGGAGNRHRLTGYGRS